MQQDPPAGATLPELARLARALEAGGIYNGAKLVRAVLERELAEAAGGAPLDSAATAAGVARLARDMEGRGEDGQLVAALCAAADAAAAERTLALAEAPRTWSCRVCGRIWLGAVPDWCPDCEAPAPVAREHVPVWYLDPMSPADAMAELEAGLAALGRLVGGRSDEAMARAPSPGEWSVRETLQHLLTAETLLATRVPRLLDEDEPDLVAAAAWVLPPSDEATTATDLPASALLARLRALRGGTLTRLHQLDARDWERAGCHPEWGRVTVTSQAAYFARHLWSHLAQVRAATDGRVPGRG